MQGVIDRNHDGFDAGAIGFGVALGRARAEHLLSAETVFQEVMGAGPQEELKHACIFRFEAPDQKMGPRWLIKVESFAPLGAALRHPGPPGPLMLLIELEPAPLAGIGRDLRLLAVEPLELERLLGSQADQDAATSPVDEIPPWRVVRRARHGVSPKSRHDSLPSAAMRAATREPHAGCKSSECTPRPQIGR